MKSSVVVPGSVAPDFALPGLDGRVHRLAAFRGQPTLLLFYRGHWCSTCRRQLEMLAGVHDEVQERSAAVVAISSEPIERLVTEPTATALPFTVLSDRDAAVIAAYGVTHVPFDEEHPYARPSVFVLDASGVVAFAYVGANPGDRPAIGSLLLALDALA